MKRKVPWTAEDDARLLKMVENNRARPLIAASLRRTVAAVQNRLWILREADNTNSTDDTNPQTRKRRPG
jgi:hypothetical protein